MIFQYTLPQILCEEKTQTRRIIQPNESAMRGRNNQILAVKQNDRIKWQVGNDYSVQPGRGKAQVARIRLLRIRSEHIQRIHTVDALAEGFTSRQHFLSTWITIHGKDSLNARVWVLFFEVSMLIQPQKEDKIQSSYSIFPYAETTYAYQRPIGARALLP